MRLEKYNIGHGVMQSNHWKNDSTRRIQVCSAQTLERRNHFPEIDLLIVDECHITRSKITKIIQENPKLKVIGLRAKAGSGSFGPSIDDQLFVPYKYAARKFDLNRRSIDKVITIKASSYDMVGYVESEVTGIIRASRGLKPTVEDNFSINKQEMIMKQIDTIFGYLEKSGIVIAGFSLLIGVFSIGNIMYISVKERTNEIGVQKALGSTQPFILYQFLIESVLVCIFGGMLGMLCLYGAVAAAQYAIQKMEISMQIIVSQGSVQAAIFLSLGIGLLAGIIPAFLAARVDPVIAIRSK
jgi:putative ABC transport system permease protein